MVTFDENLGFDPNSPKQSYGTYFTAYMVEIPSSVLHSVLTNSLKTFGEYMVLDTACQRTCCSTKWFELWESKIREKFNLFAKKTPNREPFEFGHGPAQYSHLHAYVPTAFDF